MCSGLRILSSSSVLPAVVPSPLVWSAAVVVCSSVDRFQKRVSSIYFLS